MSKDNHPTKDESSLTVPPLFSAADRDLDDHPVSHVPEERLYPLQEVGRRIANSWSGSVKNHRTGKVGEDAVAKPLGARESIDLNVYADGGDAGFDLTYGKATIDVKTAKQCRSNPDLVVNRRRRRSHPDYYVLASRIGETDVRLIGYTSGQAVARAPVEERNGEPCHVVRQRMLLPFPSFI